MSVALVGHAAVLAVWPGAHTLLIDLQVYRAAGEHLVAGEPLYAGGVLLDLPFVYPPVAAAAFVPSTWLPLPALKVLWTVGSLVLLGFVAHRGLRSLGVPSGRVPIGASVALVAVATWLDPVRTTLYLGQVNVVVMALVVGDLLARRGPRGVGIGLAAALKLTPLLFVGYLLVTGRLRAAGTAAATFLLAAGVGFLVAPADSVTFWLRGTFAEADRISAPAATTNHSLNGLLARAAGAGPGARDAYLVGAALLVAATLAVAARTHRRGEELLAVALCGLGSAAAAPFAWSHHWVWFGPLLVALGHRAVRTRDRATVAAAAAGLAVTAAVLTSGAGPGVGPIPRTGLISLFPDAYLVTFLALLAAVALGRPAGERDEGPAGPPAEPSSRSDLSP